MGPQQEKEKPGFAGVCEGMRYCTNSHVEAAGIEPVSANADSSTGCKESLTPRGTESGTVGVECVPTDQDLQLIVRKWAKLPEVVRLGIMAMVKAARGG